MSNSEIFKKNLPLNNTVNLKIKNAFNDTEELFNTFTAVSLQDKYDIFRHALMTNKLHIITLHEDFDINTQERDGKTFLMSLIDLKDILTVLSLETIDPNIRDNKGKTFLDYYLEKIYSRPDDLEQILLTLKIKVTPDQGKSENVKAILRRYFHFMNLNKEGIIKELDNFPWTKNTLQLIINTTRLAIRNNKFEIIKILLIFAKNKTNMEMIRLCFYVLYSKNQFSILYELFNYYDTFNLCTRSAEADDFIVWHKIVLSENPNINFLRNLLKHDKDLRKCANLSVNNEKLLYTLCSQKNPNLEMIKLLLEFVDINDTNEIRKTAKYDNDDNDDNGGEPAILGAAKNGNIEVVRLLLGYKGINLNIKIHHVSLLHNICNDTDIDLEIFKLLVESPKLDINIKDFYGGTALHMVYVIERAEVLLINGADVNARDDYKDTPLINACYADDVELAKLLILYGADVNARNESTNQTPLDVAFENGNVEMLKLFRQYKISPEERKKIDTIVQIHEKSDSRDELLEKLKNFFKMYEPTFLCKGSTYEALTRSGNINKFLNKNIKSYIEILESKVIEKEFDVDDEIVFIIYKTGNNGLHALVLDIDKTNLSLELFDPNGIFGDIEYYKPLYIALKESFPEYKINEISKTCTYYGPQFYGRKMSRSKCPPGKYFGYCGVYSIFYITLRIKYPNIDRKEIMDVLNDLSRANDYYIERFITFIGLK